MRMCDHCGQLLEDDFQGVECPSCGAELPAAGETTQQAVVIPASGHVTTLAPEEQAEIAESMEIDREPTDLAEWLEYHDLGHLAATFASQNVDLETLEHLSEQDLVELGLPLGDRRKVFLSLGRDPAEVVEEPVPPSVIRTREILLVSAILLAICFFAPWSLAGAEPVFAWDLIDQAAGVLRLEVILLPFAAILFLVLTSIEVPLVARKVTSVAVSVAALVIFFSSEEMNLLSDAARAGVFGLGIHVTLLYTGLAAIAVAALVWAYRPGSILARVMGGMALASVVITYLIPLRIQGFEAATSLLQVVQTGLGEAQGAEQMFLIYLLVPCALSLAFVPLFFPADDDARGRAIFARILSYAAIVYLPVALITANARLLADGTPNFVLIILALVIGLYGSLFTTGATSLLIGSRDVARKRLSARDAIASLQHRGVLTSEDAEALEEKLGGDNS